jgi:hypothetical protein
VFCNRAAGWGKGFVEKNVQHRRRGLWREASERRRAGLQELDDWLGRACRNSWAQMKHPQWPKRTVGDVWQDAQTRLMPCPSAFDGYIEQPVRMSATALIHDQRNLYSVPCEWGNSVVSLRTYPERLVVVSPDVASVGLVRSFGPDQTLYDWTH